MTVRNDANVNVVNGSTTNGSGSMPAFYTEISSITETIDQYNANVQKISDIHSRSLGAIGDHSQQEQAARLDALIAENRTLSNSVKQRIAALAATAQGPQKDQTKVVSRKFMEAIQGYQVVEQEHRKRYREQVERQFKIVKPDATQEEINAILQDDQGGSQVFAQALSSSTRYGESRAAYREVQDRHAEIRKMTDTLAELTVLFNDMAVLVEQQNEKLDQIQEVAAKVEQETETGVRHTERAAEHARSARKMRIIMFLIFLLVIAIIALVLGLKYGLKSKSNS